MPVPNKVEATVPNKAEVTPPLTTSAPSHRGWTYATLTVMDGCRSLKPAQAAFDRLYFAEPPRLTSAQIEIILTNGDAEQRHAALVLPHDPNATRIPIRLLPGE